MSKVKFETVEDIQNFIDRLKMGKYDTEHCNQIISELSKRAIKADGIYDGTYTLSAGTILNIARLACLFGYAVGQADETKPDKPKAVMRKKVIVANG